MNKLNAEQKLMEEIADLRRDAEPILLEDSKAYRSIVDLIKNTLDPEKIEKDGLDQTHRMLIALGIAISNGSKSSIEWTMTRALNHGANDRMIKDAIDVGLLMGGGSAVASVRSAYNALNLRKLKPRKS